MKSLEISVHSFVDLITNSSTEVFIQSTDKTVAGIKNIVNALLEVANSELEFDDLFDVKLGTKAWDYETKSYVFKESSDEKDEFYERIILSVKPKINGDSAAEAAKLLEGLVNIFEAKEVAN
jgi:hypothetical protein